MSEKGFNKHAPVNKISTSDKTVARYRAEAELVTHKGELKNSGRNEAYLNIRNAIACAAMLTSLERNIDFENFHSSDDVGILLNGCDEKVMVVFNNLPL